MKRIDKLLAAMTIEEKIGQLSMAAGEFIVTGPVLAGEVAEGVRAGRIGNLLNLRGAEEARAIQRVAVEESRLKIPLLIGFDVLHGHNTIFPIPLAEAALFDPHFWELSARAAAIEAAADGIAMTFAPMLDIARDPRWGRIAEGPGEDPWVAARFAEAKVRGFQGSNLAAADAIAATAKHFCAYGAALAGRDYASADVSERLLHEIYLPPFAAAIAAGCAAIMPGFNDLNGVPMTAHVPLLRDWLRRQHGFEGVIISDYNAIAELLNHGVAADLAEAAAAALQAGVDIDMMSDAYRQGLPTALVRGLVAMDQIDGSVRRVLALKERLGLFDDPFRRGASQPRDPREATVRRELARDIARRAIVVLTNDGVLPFSRELRRIALIGPLADAGAEMRGPWPAAGDADDCVTVLQALTEALPNAEIVFERGVGIEDDDVSGIAPALAVCRGADLVLLCLGEAAAMSGEAASRANPDLPGHQAELAQAVLDQGKPTVALVFSGRPLIIPMLVERARAVVAAWFLGAEAGHAVADVLTGAFNPTGRLPVTWPRHIGQVPIFYAERPTGRPAGANELYASKYLDMPTEPLFPFGHGLSYSRFALANLRASSESFWLGDEIIVTVDVFNEGPVAGEETLFLFARDMVASVARPLLELKGVAKIALRAGESGIVQFPLPVRSLRFLDVTLRPRLEPGEFRLSVGPSADPRRHLTIALCALPD
ncbi:glycoside hydrolase family 3 N-terminal domain-containing protein [Methylocapsa polymorpha]|uniref:beta-glucosidase n=1 Tax=Methylocapsa polymorpha TaxID=3080828 RepID=A0ABZ0HRP2_9HYPH|nr:glycoside hydrolase family 3 N-terminal domain-containing protein [Methylocapsa sp. RX1]